MCASATAGVLDASSRAALAEKQATLTTTRNGEEDFSQRYYPLIVSLTNARGLDELHAAGAVVFRQREDMVICCVPAENIDMIDNAEWIETATLGTTATPVMDMAREAAGVTPMASGNGFDMPYDGTGVVAGLCDTGFDACHIDFHGRVGMFCVYDETQASRELYLRPDDIKNKHTDTEHQYHATHVAGIMAGGYTANGYQGVATGATLAATTSALTDTGVLAGIEDIIEYADSEGKPAVVNISLGNYTGPHDGTTLFNRYLSLLGRKAVICVSAGNNGDSRHSLSGSFSAENGNTLSTSISTWDNLNPHGELDIWGYDASELSVEFGIFDTDTNKWILKTKPTGSGERSSWVMTDTPDAFAGDANRMIANYEAFNRLFDGYIVADGETDRRNGRYHIAVRFDYNTYEKSKAGAWARYRITVSVTGREGNRADIFTDGSATMLRAIAATGSADGDDTMSISDMACGDNVISVGMSVSRDSYPTVGGDELATGYTAGTVCRHSSYGTTPDGRILPHITAPGWHVVSAYSGPYAAAHPEDTHHSVCAEAQGHTWTAMGGTSMASPMVAGTVACWLQALPHLTVDEVTEALHATARQDMPDATDPRYGASGTIDATAGLSYLLSRDPENGITTTGTDTPTARSTIWNLSGTLVATFAGDTPDPNLLRPGVYILRTILSGNRTICRKIVVR